jgi:hypothetical protein
MVPSLPVLLVYDPDPSLAGLLQEQLEGWQVQSAATQAEIPGRNCRAVLLAGEGDHTAIARSLRQTGMIGPLFSTHDDASAPLIALPLPLRLPMLAAKLQAPNGSAVDGAVIGKWRLDMAQRALVDGVIVERLTDKEVSLLSLLLLAMPETVDRERLQTEIWRYHAEADTHTVETHVWRLRQKLERDPTNPEILLTGSNGYFINRQSAKF